MMNLVHQLSTENASKCIIFDITYIITIFAEQHQSKGTAVRNQSLPTDDSMHFNSTIIFVNVQFCALTFLKS